MKLFIQAIFFSLFLVSCQTNDDSINKNLPFTISIKEHDVILSLDLEGNVFQNDTKIGVFSEDKLIDVSGNVVFKVNEENAIVDTENVKVAQLNENGSLDLLDDFIGVIKWNDNGELIDDNGELIGVHLSPNSSDLHRKAFLVLLYGEHMKE